MANANEFGKRKPAVRAATHAPLPKRSHHVALLMVGTIAVGGNAYSLLPRQNCEPNSAAMAAPSSPQAAAACASRSSSSGGGGGGSRWWSRSGFYGGSASTTETARGGFGGFARAIGAHFSGS